ncbi:hypothetical protein GCM10010409_15720 [Mycolicibacterium diernhoferi]|uniref:Uncharacterized protein n=1 Tax=Mycolicibacterium diernhoferi TaxID=1801 RepID=A0A1Q4HI20_9MYCO|nr:hypothetical protein BRW64_08060 [Mycolicibacterium diernhoferi]OPE46681.1 hypothetical protein BV510_26055 [Mycolicibacterium diernhoferi]PEG52578.1 hypothetical protein CRI78_20535 [Mycolicibacterium diernhoferi]
MAVTGDPKWHERTPTLLAASVAALAAIGLIVWLTMVVVRQAGSTEPAPLEYVTPFADTSSSSATTTTATTSVSTTTRPVETTDISEVIDPSASSTTSSTTTRTRTSTTRAEDAEETTTTTKRRARQNETRTLYPAP